MLLLVMLVSLPFAWARLLPADFVAYAKSALAALFFSSNFFFYFSTTEYAADSALLMPLLHTWTLGVEEQFYFAFPLVAVAAHKLFGGRLWTVVLLLALVSLLLANTTEVRNPEFNFFSPFSRFWELAVGSLLAARELGRPVLAGRAVRIFFPLLGLCLAAGAIAVFDEKTPHPGFATLVPVSGVALVIAYSTGGDPVGRLLGSRVLVAIGLVSYSAYLWHFPIMAFGRIANPSVTNVDRLAWIACTFLLSIMSYHAVEKPCRARAIVPLRWFFLLVLVSAAILVAFSVAVVRSGGFPGRVPSILLQADTAVPVWAQFTQDGEMCYDRRDRFCSVPGHDTGVTLYAFGDSHFSALSEALVRKLDGRVNYVEANATGCPFVLGVSRRRESGRIERRCTESYQQARLALLGKTPSIIMVGGRFPLYLHKHHFYNREGGQEEAAAFWREFISADGAPFADKALETYRKLLDEGHHLVIVYPIPPVGWNVPGRLLERLQGKDLAGARNELIEHPLTTSSAVYADWARSTFAMFDSLEDPHIHRVYPHKLFCDATIPGRCVTHDADDVYYADDDHPSRRGAEMISDLIVRAVLDARRDIESR